MGSVVQLDRFRKKLSYFIVVGKEEEPLFSCMEQKAGVITVFVKAKSIDEAERLRRECVAMLDHGVDEESLALGVVVR